MLALVKQFNELKTPFEYEGQSLTQILLFKLPVVGLKKYAYGYDEVLVFDLPQIFLLLSVAR